MLVVVVVISFFLHIEKYIDFSIKWVFALFPNSLWIYIYFFVYQLFIPSSFIQESRGIFSCLGFSVGWLQKRHELGCHRRPIYTVIQTNLAKSSFVLFFFLFKISPVNSLKNCQQQKERVHSFSESLTYFYSSLLMRHFCAKQIHQNLPSWVDAKNITWTTFLCCSFIISSSCFFFCFVLFVDSWKWSVARRPSRIFKSVTQSFERGNEPCSSLYNSHIIFGHRSSWNEIIQVNFVHLFFPFHAVYIIESKLTSQWIKDYVKRVVGTLICVLYVHELHIELYNQKKGSRITLL